MVDTFTKFLNLTKPEVGASRDTWGAKQNDALDKIDTWAETTDGLVKGALVKVATALQEVTGPLKFSGAVEMALAPTLSAGFTVPANQRGIFGSGSILAETERFVVAAPGSVFEVLNAARSASVMKVTTTEIALTGNKKAWTENNFKPTDYLNRVATDLQITAADIEIGKTNPAIWLNFPSGKRARWALNSDGRLTWRDATGQDHFRIESNGAVWTQEIGDVKTYIGSTASSAASSAASTAQTNAINTATSRINNKTLRFVFAGDLGSAWNSGGGISEPYPGAVMTARSTIPAGSGNAWESARFRYIQMSDSNGNFYSIGF